jgi:hypothetical protein
MDALPVAALMIVVGLWVLARTFTHDKGGKNLVDRILSL